MTEEEKKKQDEQQEAAAQPAVETQTPPMPIYDYKPKYTGTEAQLDSKRAYLDTLNQRWNQQQMAEDDKRRRLGRTFWTGATIAANTIANAINVNGTGNYAPSMQWDTNQQKMLDQWRADDDNLAKQRREAQERIDNLNLDLGKLTDDDRMKREAAEKAAYDINFNNQMDAWKRDKDNAFKAGEAQKNRDAQAAKVAAEQAGANHRAGVQASTQKYVANSKNSSKSSGSGAGSGFAIGNMEFGGLPKGGDSVILNGIYQLMKNANKKIVQEDGTVKTEPYLIEEEKYLNDDNKIRSVVNQHFDEMWQEDPEFNAALTGFLQRYGKHQTGWSCKYNGEEIVSGEESEEKPSKTNNSSNNKNNSGSNNGSFHL